MPMCCGLPTPPEPYFNCPGDALAAARKSSAVLKGESGFTTSPHSIVPTSESGSKSFSAS
jgi:hypothetical protein